MRRLSNEDLATKAIAVAVIWAALVSLYACWDLLSLAQAIVVTPFLGALLAIGIAAWRDDA